MTARKGDKSGSAKKPARTGRWSRRSPKTSAFAQKATGSRNFRSRSAKRNVHGTELPRIRSDQIAWASGGGVEIATLHGHLDDLVAAVLQRMEDGVLMERASFLEEGPDSALVVGPPGRALVCLVANEELAPGIVAVIGDAAGDRAEAIGAVERLLGRGFEVHPHAA